MTHEERDIAKNCRLCLGAIFNNDFLPVGNGVSQKLAELFMKVNLEISDNPIICNKCAAKLQNFSDFKWKFLCTENVTRSLKDSKENSALHLREVNLNKNENDINDISEPHRMCSFCAEITNEFIQLHDTKENMFMLSELQNHIPSLNITEELIACKSCFDLLKGFHAFVTKSIDVEEKISKYIDTEGTDDNGHIQLNSIAKFTYNDDLIRVKEGTICNKIKTEALLEGDKVEMCIKTEEINLKTELADSDSKDTAATQQLDIFKYECPKCSFKTEYQWSFFCHTLIHLDSSRLYECDKCPFKSKSKSNLTQHLNKHSGVKIRPKHLSKVFKCDLCSYEVGKLLHLKWHMLSHKILSGITLFECNKCSYITRYKQHLAPHMTVHKDRSELTMYKCYNCEFETKYKRNMERHAVIHSRVNIGQ